MEKVVAYVRVSSHPNSAHSVITQSMKNEEYCKAHDYMISDSLITIGDRKTAYPVFSKLLQSAADKGITKVVMATANRIIGSVEEIEDVRAAIDASGVTIETLDGTHEELPYSNTLVKCFLAYTDLAEQAELAAEDEDYYL